jgi:thiol:disulfide interchange protein DsbD
MAQSALQDKLSSVLRTASIDSVDAGQPELLSPEQAFIVQSPVVQGDHLRLEWRIADGYYLYQSRLNVMIAGQPIHAAILKLPPATSKFDATFNKNVMIYRQTLIVTVPLSKLPVTLQSASTAPTAVQLGWQGCADVGVCYPPQQRQWMVRLPVLSRTAQSQSVLDSAALEPIPSSRMSEVSSTQEGEIQVAPLPLPQQIVTTPAPTAWQWSDVMTQDTAHIQRWFTTIHPILLLMIFWFVGVLLAFTPCMLPMLPIMASTIFATHLAKRNTVWHKLSRGMAFTAGMAIVYASMGLLAAYLGQGLAGYLQHPVVLCGFALLLCVMALGMFDVLHIQLPSGLQNWLNQRTQHWQGASWWMSAGLGGVSALLVGPCVAPPLVATLLYIGQTQAYALGAGVLMMMAIGMCTPLLLLSLSAERFVPKTGRWMHRVKALFGVLLIVSALVMVAPVVSRWVVQWASPQISPTPSELSAHNAVESRWEKVSSIEALNTILQTSTQPVMVDVYADWCIACKELDQFTFSKMSVQTALAGYRWVKLDVTANTSAHQQWLKQQRIFGPPVILFFAKGQEQVSGRVVGFINEARLLSHVQQHQLVAQ